MATRKLSQAKCCRKTPANLAEENSVYKLSRKICIGGIGCLLFVIMGGAALVAVCSPREEELKFQAEEYAVP